uniref:NADH-ubiquinone oxidoreductase chain 4L n=1 Tax=Uromastyx benti TaxID=236742 RepID=D6RR67_9SAUR|nr:NADH dehydrogenase subunit 4L [Uromastyx benti]BAJ08055.1 NADH dehydrogenase subunit 4L [Uromastyx benti]
MSLMHFMLSAMFMITMAGACTNQNHLMSTLLCIEGMTLVLFASMSMMTSALHFHTSTTMPMMMLTLNACEASTGLTLLAIISKTHSNDQLKNINLLQC